MNRQTDIRPESEEELKRHLENGEPLWTECLRCKKTFSSENTHTNLGWMETQISGFCEDCFDEVMP